MATVHMDEKHKEMSETDFIITNNLHWLLLLALLAAVFVTFLFH